MHAHAHTAAGRYRGDASTLPLRTRRHTPPAFRPPLERLLTTLLTLAASALWLGVLPAEIALRLT